MKKAVFLFGILTVFFSCEKKDISPDVVETTVGESFDIKLKTNWSTGYHWSWINRDSISVADTTDFEYVVDDPDLEGSPGTEIWTFQAKSKGDETVIFWYLTASSSGSAEDLIRKIRVVVK